MKMYVNGREIDIPANQAGEVEVVDVRRAANIPDDRVIMRQTPLGENFIMPRHGTIQANPYEHFLESPRGRRGR